MKNEHVVPDYKIMLETSVTLLALVASGWLLIKLISACFWLPGFLKKWQLEENNVKIGQLNENEESMEDDKLLPTEEMTSDAREDINEIPESKQDEENKKDK